MTAMPLSHAKPYMSNVQIRFFHAFTAPPSIMRFTSLIAVPSDLGGKFNLMVPGSEQALPRTDLEGPMEIFVYVGTDGTRFVDETAAIGSKHGYIDFHGRSINMQVPVPAYAIFDDTARAAGKIYASWSEGNLEEIEKGWIVKADTIAELAAKIGIVAYKNQT